MSEQANGVVALAIDADGRVIASVADFDRPILGGLALREGQEMRAKQALSRAVVSAYCSDVVVQALNPGEIDRVMQALIRNGLTRRIVVVGYDQDPRA